MEREDRMNSFAKEQKHAQAMKTLKEAILQLSMSQNPSCSQSQRENLQKLIDVRLPSLVSSPLHIPEHPPYAQMIIAALRNLKRKKGSTKTSISSYIKSEYQDLPLAHERLLDHHIRNLVKVGEIVSVTKSLYTLPVHNDSNRENQQQKGEQQSIVVGGQKVGKVDNNNINSGEVVALPENYPTSVVEVTEPVDLESVGSGLMSLSERHPTTLLNLETVSGERSPEQHPEKIFKGKQNQPQVTTQDDDGGMITLLDRQPATVIEATKPMKKLPGQGCGSPSDKKSEEVQLQETMRNIVLAMPSTICDTACDDSAVHNHSRKQQPWHRGRPQTRSFRGKQKQLVTQNDNGGLTTLLKRNPRSAIEAVKPLQKMLLGCGSEASPSKESEAAEQEDKAGNVAIVAAAAADAVGCDHSLKQQPQLRGRPPKRNIKDKQKQQIIMQDRDRELMTLLEMHPPAVIEVVKPLQKILLGRGCEGLHHKENAAAQQQEVGNIAAAAAAADDLAAPNHPLEQQPKSRRRPREKYNVKQKQTQITTQDDDGGSISLLERQLPIVIEVVKPMKRKLPGRGRGRLPNRRNEAEQLQEKVGNTVETIPLAITDASVPADVPAVSYHSLEQQPHRRGTPLKRKFQENHKQVVMQHDEAVKPMKRKLPGRGRGRPPNRRNEAEQLREKVGNTVEKILLERHPISMIEPVKPLQKMLPRHGREVMEAAQQQEEVRNVAVGDGGAAATGAAATAAAAAAADDSAYCNHPLEQLPRTRGRPPKRVKGKQKQQELAQAGDRGLLILPERHPTTVFKVVEPLQKMLPGCCPPASLKKNSEVAQTQDEVGNIAAAAVNVAEQQQQRRRGRPKKKFEGEIQPQVTAQHDDGALTPLLSRKQAIVIEAVKPMKRKLPGRGRGRPPNEKKEAEQLGEMGDSIERTAVSDAAAANDDPSAC